MIVQFLSELQFFKKKSQIYKDNQINHVALSDPASNLQIDEKSRQNLNRSDTMLRDA